MRINDGGFGRYIERLQFVLRCLKTLRIKGLYGVCNVRLSCVYLKLLKFKCPTNFRHTLYSKDYALKELETPGHEEECENRDILSRFLQLDIKLGRWMSFAPSKLYPCRSSFWHPVYTKSKKRRSVDAVKKQKVT